MKQDLINKIHGMNVVKRCFLFSGTQLFYNKLQLKRHETPLREGKMRDYCKFSTRDISRSHGISQLEVSQIYKFAKDHKDSVVPLEKLFVRMYL